MTAQLPKNNDTGIDSTSTGHAEGSLAAAAQHAWAQYPAICDRSRVTCTVYSFMRCAAHLPTTHPTYRRRLRHLECKQNSAEEAGDATANLATDSMAKLAKRKEEKRNTPPVLSDS